MMKGAKAPFFIMKRTCYISFLLVVTIACKPCRTTVANAGPDQLNCTGTTTLLNASMPQVDEVGTWSVVQGSGAVFSSPNSPSTVFTKGADSSYAAVWAIFGPCGASIDTIHVNFPAPILPSCGQVISFAGENYPSVKIGSQCWLTKNMNVGQLVDSTADQGNNGLVEKYCYQNDTTKCSIYGGLYQWAEAVQYQNNATNLASPIPAFSGNVQGICPQGWHVPSDAEWCTLIKGLDPSYSCTTLGWSGSNGGGKLKSTNNLWPSFNVGANNLSGFSALPSGYRNNRTFYSLGIYTGFWSISEGISSVSIISSV